MMKLQVRKTLNGSLALTYEEGEILPGQVSVQIVGEKIIVEYGLSHVDIALSDMPALVATTRVNDDWTKTGRDRELS